MKSECCTFELCSHLGKLNQDEKPMSFEVIWNHMEIGPLNCQEGEELRDSIKRNLDASVRSADDIDSFNRFEYV